MNQYFQKGYPVVQGSFRAKNSGTDFARMDAIGDMFNFFIEREMRMKLGLSSAIWGSGIAIRLCLYKNVNYTHFLGGFDKRLQAHLVQNTNRIAFAPEAVLYDEKVSSGEALQTQRTRWISSYFKYFGESFQILMRGLLRLNFNLFYFGYVLLRPPLFIVLLGAVVIALANLFISITMFYVWVALLLAFGISFITIVVIKSRDPRFIMAIFKLPLFVGRQLLALLKIRRASKSFMKTQHINLVYIDEVRVSGETNKL